MKNSMKVIFLTYLLCLIFFIGKSQDNSLPNKLEMIMESNTIPGLSLTHIENGEISDSFALGVKSLDTPKAISEKTVFSAASLSKPIFAYLIMQLVDEGLLELNTPLTSYYDYKDVSSDKRHSEVTASMVLSHTSGLPNWRRKKLKFIADPGEKYSYSGEGYVWLQRVVEHLKGQTLEELAQEYVFKPLEMNRSSYIFLEEFEDDFTLSHKSKGEVRGKNKIQNPNAAASLQTTSEDYAKFLLALYAGERISGENQKLLFTPVKTTQPKEDDPKVYWGMGVGLQMTEDGPQIFQWGDNYTFKGFFTLNVSTGNGLVYLSNSENGLSPLLEITSLFLDDPQPAADWLNY